MLSLIHREYQQQEESLIPLQEYHIFAFCIFRIGKAFKISWTPLRYLINWLRVSRIGFWRACVPDLPNAKVPYWGSKRYRT